MEPCLLSASSTFRATILMSDSSKVLELEASNRLSSRCLSIKVDGLSGINHVADRGMSMGRF